MSECYPSNIYFLSWTTSRRSISCLCCGLGSRPCLLPGVAGAGVLGKEGKEGEPSNLGEGFMGLILACKGVLGAGILRIGASLELGAGREQESSKFGCGKASFLLFLDILGLLLPGLLEDLLASVGLVGGCEAAVLGAGDGSSQSVSLTHILLILRAFLCFLGMSGLDLGILFGVEAWQASSSG